MNDLKSVRKIRYSSLNKVETCFHCQFTVAPEAVETKSTRQDSIHTLQHTHSLKKQSASSFLHSKNTGTQSIRSPPALMHHHHYQQKNQEYIARKKINRHDLRPLNGSATDYCRLWLSDGSQILTYPVESLLAISNLSTIDTAPYFRAKKVYVSIFFRVLTIYHMELAKMQNLFYLDDFICFDDGYIKIIQLHLKSAFNEGKFSKSVINVRIPTHSMSLKCK